MKRCAATRRTRSVLNAVMLVRGRLRLGSSGRGDVRNDILRLDLILLVLLGEQRVERVHREHIVVKVMLDLLGGGGG